jgi:OmpA-OmpF porin, OOP family
MSNNLLDLVKGQLSDSIIKKAADFLDDDAGASQKALNLILPSILGGFANKATSPEGAEGLLTSMNDSKMDGSMLDSLGLLLGGGSATHGLLKVGQGLVGSIFGDRVGQIANWLSAFAGIKNGTASNLMNIAAPMIVSAIQKQLGGNATAGSLTTLLGEQLPFLRQANLPTALTGVLGLNNLKLTPPSVSEPKLEESVTGFGRILPWLLLLGVGLLGLLAWRSCNKAPEVITKVEEKVEAKVVAADTIPMRKLSLPNGEMLVKVGSFLDALYTEITDATLDPTKAIAFDNINFATASAVITEESKAQLDDLVKIMQGFPKVHINVEGHTDNVGKAASNKKLSEGRAAAVKTYLASHGIEGGRIATAGFGSDKPIADNATEESRAKNRRIEAFVVKK